MKFQLREGTKKDIHLYQDTSTGNVYASVGGSLVLVKRGKTSNENKWANNNTGNDDGIFIGKDNISDEDNETLNREDEERIKNDVMKRSEEEEKNRLKEIQRVFDDQEEVDDLVKETENKVLRSRQRKAELQRRIDRRNNQKAGVGSKEALQQGIDAFKKSLYAFISKQVKEKDVPIRTYSRINPRYVGSGILVKGTKIEKQKKGKKPLINVYFDRSGSWHASDTEKARQALNVLHKFEDENKLSLDIYYFANRVTEVDDGSAGSGTYGQPIIDHIKQTQPDNVIIMTDDDIFDLKNSYTIPGALWILWKRGQVSNNLKDNIHGRRGNFYFSID